MPIAMITDFGRDVYPGLMKSVIRKIFPDAVVIDLTHNIPPQDVKTAAYVTRSSHRRLPNKSVILSVVDPGVGTDRRILVAKAIADNYEYYFVAPDNGLLSVVDRYVKNLLKGSIEYYSLKPELMQGKEISRTFHGRDLFAPLAAKIAKAIKENSFYESLEEIGLEKAQPIIDDSLRLEVGRIGKLKVAYTDHFGDIILNSLRWDPKANLDLREGLFKYDKYAVKTINGTFIARPSRHYDPNKRIVLTVGSGGLLEIARPFGSARDLIGDIDEVEIEPL